MLFDIENNDLFENIKENNKTYSNYNNTVKNALNFEKTVHTKEENALKNEKTVHTCLHCGNDTPLYCEKCQQELITKNAELQLEIEELKNNKKVVANINIALDDMKECIPKQKIRDKIEEIENEFNFYAGREHTEWQDGEFDGEVCDDLALQIKVLKELLGE